MALKFKNEKKEQQTYKINKLNQFIKYYQYVRFRIDISNNNFSIHVKNIIDKMSDINILNNVMEYHVVVTTSGMPLNLQEQNDCYWKSMPKFERYIGKFTNLFFDKYTKEWMPHNLSILNDYIYYDELFKNLKNKIFREITVLQFAIENEAFEIAKYMIYKGAIIQTDTVYNVLKRYNNNNHATEEQYYNFIQLILKKNINCIYWSDAYNKTVLYYAMLNNFYKIIPLLISHQYDSNSNIYIFDDIIHIYTSLYNLYSNEYEYQFISILKLLLNECAILRYTDSNKLKQYSLLLNFLINYKKLHIDEIRLYVEDNIIFPSTLYALIYDYII